MKIKFEGIEFDSELEVEYYKYLKEKLIKNEEVIYFIYHPIPLNMGKTGVYTPDFIVFYNDKIEVIETKGYNPYSKARDATIHSLMLDKTEDELRKYVKEAFYESTAEKWVQDKILRLGCLINEVKVEYKKIKHLNKFGWVDFSFKNPNTRVNKQKAKINDLEAELKELRAFKKDTLKYFTLYNTTNKKLTVKQCEFMSNYINRIEEEINEKG